MVEVGAVVWYTETLGADRAWLSVPLWRGPGPPAEKATLQPQFVQVNYTISVCRLQTTGGTLAFLFFSLYRCPSIWQPFVERGEAGQRALAAAG